MSSADKKYKKSLIGGIARGINLLEYNYGSMSPIDKKFYIDSLREYKESTKRAKNPNDGIVLSTAVSYSNPQVKNAIYDNVKGMNVANGKSKSPKYYDNYSGKYPQTEVKMSATKLKKLMSNPHQLDYAFIK